MSASAMAIAVNPSTRRISSQRTRNAAAMHMAEKVHSVAGPSPTSALHGRSTSS
ncbi:MAG TPA: hypothetical protein VHM30_13325 [Gemmatimonadaceae bacterium]|nr:hypothetical protein [Gemmatimonadaceae bacterium]